MVTGSPVLTYIVAIEISDASRRGTSRKANFQPKTRQAAHRLHALPAPNKWAARLEEGAVGVSHRHHKTTPRAIP